ncbi:CHAT domain-containing protein [Nocardia salmonicida]|uniref:CHAT domain-containing protein n=1 Tax=Nocardia salmonicida TaxID=53431 RepID=UPI0007A3E592|nr:CHAT domain-containing protein [Nocardia salmonicida]
MSEIVETLLAAPTLEAAARTAMRHRAELDRDCLRELLDTAIASRMAENVKIALAVARVARDIDMTLDALLVVRDHLSDEEKTHLLPSIIDDFWLCGATDQDAAFAIAFDLASAYAREGKWVEGSRALERLHDEASARGWPDTQRLARIIASEIALLAENFELAYHSLENEPVLTASDDGQDAAYIANLYAACAKGMYYIVQDHCRSLSLASKALQIDPDNLLATIMSLFACIKLNENEKALSIADRLSQLPGEQDYVMYNRATALQRLARIDECLPVLDRLVIEYPDYAKAHHFRGNIQFSNQDWEAALESFRAAFRLCITGDVSEEFETLRLAWSGIINTRKHMSDPLASISDLDQAADSDNVEVAVYGLYGQARLLWEYGQADAAVARLDRIQALRPDSDSIILRAEILWRTGRMDEAVDYLVQQLDVDTVYVPQALEGLEGWIGETDPSAGALALRGRMKATMGQAEAAIADLQLSLQIKPGVVRTFYWLGIALVTDDLTTGRGPNRDHLLVGARYIAIAAVLLRDSDRYIRTFKWLIDRIHMDWDLYVEFLSMMDAIEPKAEISFKPYDILPGLGLLDRAIAASMQYADAKDFEQANEAILFALKVARVGDLPAIEMLLIQRAADLLIRIRQPQQALDLLAGIDALQRRVAARPPFPIAFTTKQGSPQPVDSEWLPHLHAAAEYAGLLHLVDQNTPRVGFILNKACALSMLRDHEAAMRTLPSIEEIAEFDFDAEGLKTVACLLDIARVLRDGRRFDSAHAVVLLAEKAATTKYQKSQVECAAGLIQAQRGDDASALRHYCEASKLDDNPNPRDRAIMALNVAVASIGINDVAAAEAALLDIEDSLEVLPGSQTESYWFLRSKCSYANGRLELCLEQLRRSEAAAEHTRGLISVPRYRATSQWPATSISEMRISLSIYQGDARDALAGLENVKARVIHERILALEEKHGNEIGDADVVPHTGSIHDTEARLDAMRTLLQAADSNGFGAVNWEIIDTLGGRKRYLSINGQGSLEVDRDAAQQVLDHLHSKLDELRLRQTQLPAQAATDDTTTESASDAVLVELFVEDDRISFIAHGAHLTDPVIRSVLRDRGGLERMVRNMTSQHPQPWLLRSGPWSDPTLRSLVDEISGTCPPGSHLVLIPHQELHALPLHAVRSRDGRTLSERFTLSYAPSNSLLVRCLRSRTPRSASALVLADATSDLACARIEGYEVAGILGAALLVGRNVTKREAVAQLAQRPTIVHIACHGYFGSTTRQSASIKLCGSTPNTISADTDLTAEDLISMRVDASLVVMTACSSGVGVIHTGDEIDSLITAWLIAGASTVIATLWPVDDIASWLLIRRFYELLVTETSRTVAQCLHEAQSYLRTLLPHEITRMCDRRLETDPTAEPASRDISITGISVARMAQGPDDIAATIDSTQEVMRVLGQDRRGVESANFPGAHAELADGEHPYSHPYYWSGFVLVGDWRTRDYATDQH